MPVTFLTNEDKVALEEKIAASGFVQVGSRMDTNGVTVLDVPNDVTVCDGTLLFFYCVFDSVDEKSFVLVGDKKYYLVDKAGAYVNETNFYKAGDCAIVQLEDADDANSLPAFARLVSVLSEKEEDVNVEGAVLYTEQTLTDEQKAQARDNTGAANSADVEEINSLIEGYKKPVLKELEYETTEGVAIQTSDGTLVDVGTDTLCVAKVAVEPSRTYIVTGAAKRGYSAMAFYDANDNFIKSSKASAVSLQTFTDTSVVAPENAGYLRLSYSTERTDRIAKIQTTVVELVFEQNAVLYTEQKLIEEQKAQARENIGAEEKNYVTDAKFFDIDYDGIVSLKPEYRGHPVDTVNSKGEVTLDVSEVCPYSISDMGEGVNGSKIDELPEKIVIPEVINRTAVTGFQPGTFHYNYRVKEIVLPSGVAELPDYFAFNAINLHSLENTEQITKLGEYVIGATRITKAIFPQLSEVAKCTFAKCGLLYVVDVGNNLTELPEYFFGVCPCLSVVRGGAKVTKIGKQAFYMTRNLKNLPLLSNVTEIGYEGLYRSRVQFDWKPSGTGDGQCTYGDRATPVIDNKPVDYWSAVNNGVKEHLAREKKDAHENPLNTLMSQTDPRWKDKPFGNYNKNPNGGCAIYTVLHIHSALSGKTYSNPEEFAADLKSLGENEEWIQEDHNPGKFSNVAPMFNALGDALGYEATAYDSINQESYQALCDALLRGAYIASEIGITESVDKGHMVTIYGINSNGEVLVADSDYAFHRYQPYDYGVDRDLFVYPMPLQNMTSPNSRFVIVEKKQAEE